MEPLEFADLLETIYAAALEPGGWRGLVRPLAGFVGATGCTLQWRDPAFRVAESVVSSVDVDEAGVAAYVGHYARLDPWAGGWLQRGRPGVFYGADLTGGTSIAETEYYRDFARRYGMFHLIGGTLHPFGQSSGPVAASFHRPFDATDFDAQAMQRLRRVMPHLKNALQTSRALADAQMQREASQAALGRLGLGLLLVGEGERIVFANPEAEWLLREGLVLAAPNGRLRANDPERQSALAEMLRRAVTLAQGGEGPAADLLTLPRPDEAPLTLLVAPLIVAPAWAGFSHPVAAVFAYDSSRHRKPALPALIALYRFTRAEGRLVEALVAGERIGDYAERNEISINTANTQLKQAFAKTGTHRQSELIAVLLRDLVLRIAAGTGGN
jgi:DNA-binding CsgD family transcriptional regulator